MRWIPQLVKLEPQTVKLPVWFSPQFMRFSWKCIILLHASHSLTPVRNGTSHQLQSQKYSPLPLWSKLYIYWIIGLRNWGTICFPPEIVVLENGSKIPALTQNSDKWRFCLDHYIYLNNNSTCLFLAQVLKNPINVWFRKPDQRRKEKDKKGAVTWSSRCWLVPTHQH